MDSKSYEYYLANEIEISEERKQKLITNVKDNIRKDSIALHKVLRIGKNDAEWNFLYEWLEENDIEVRGINVTVAGEMPNYTHIARTRGQNEKNEIEDEYYKPLEKDVQEELFRRLKLMRQSGDFSSQYFTIRDKLITHNIGLARYIANAKGVKKYNIALDDKESYAILGLMNAVDHFDVDKGYQFSTYACKSIYFTICREITQRERNELLIMNEMAEVEEVEDEMTKLMERKPTDVEIAEIIGYDVKKVRQIRFMRDSQIDSMIMDEEIPDNDELFLLNDIYYTGDGVEIDTSRENDVIDEETEVEYVVVSNTLKDEIIKVLRTLDPREETILRLRFGIDDGEPKSQREVAEHFNISASAISVAEARALRKMRHPSRARMLKDYLDEK